MRDKKDLATKVRALRRVLYNVMTDDEVLDLVGFSEKVETMLSEIECVQDEARTLLPPRESVEGL